MRYGWRLSICSALAFNKKALNRIHLLKSLTPLYIGRIASFVIETWTSDAADVESRIEKLCVIFEDKKPLLIKNWL